MKMLRTRQILSFVFPGTCSGLDEFSLRVRALAARGLLGFNSKQLFCLAAEQFG